MAENVKVSTVFPMKKHITYYIISHKLPIFKCFFIDMAKVR